ncbi:MAG: hypothetical protein WC851_03625 [Candidatus Shapirobacteria bacterium]|jgi:hypothetical protein
MSAKSIAVGGLHHEMNKILAREPSPNLIQTILSTLDKPTERDGHIAGAASYNIALSQFSLGDAVAAEVVRTGSVYDTPSHVRQILDNLNEQGKLPVRGEDGYLSRCYEQDGRYFLETAVCSPVDIGGEKPVEPSVEFKVALLRQLGFITREEGLANLIVNQLEKPDQLLESSKFPGVFVRTEGEPMSIYLVQDAIALCMNELAAPIDNQIEKLLPPPTDSLLEPSRQKS